MQPLRLTSAHSYCSSMRRTHSSSATAASVDRHPGTFKIPSRSLKTSPSMRGFDSITQRCWYLIHNSLLALEPSTIFCAPEPQFEDRTTDYSCHLRWRTCCSPLPSKPVNFLLSSRRKVKEELKYRLKDNMLLKLDLLKTSPILDAYPFFCNLKTWRKRFWRLFASGGTIWKEARV